jgi:GNAT superfamily N-acetyltransferase
VIRVAELSDVDEVIELGSFLHEASVYSRLPFNKAKAGKTISGLIGNENGVVFVAESNGRIIGGIAGGVAEWWFCDVLHAYDYSFFVHPDHRGGRAAYRLLLAFQEWAKIKGCDDMEIGITTGLH